MFEKLHVTGKEISAPPFLSAWWKRMAAVLRVSLHPGSPDWVPQLIQHLAEKLSYECVFWEHRFDALDRCRRASETPARRLCAAMNVSDRAAGNDVEFCDVYSKGTGRCQFRDGAVDLESCGALRPHVFSGQHVAPQLFCPGAVPVAVMPALKSGSISLRTWLLSLETVELRDATEKFINLWRASGGIGLHMEMDGSGINDRISHYLVAQKNVEDNFATFLLNSPEMLGYADESAWFKLLVRTLSQVVTHHNSPFSKVGLPPQLCRTCCATGAGRLPLMIARNPFSRIESVYRKFVVLRATVNNSMISRRLGAMRFSKFVQRLDDIFKNQHVYDSIVAAASRSGYGLARETARSEQEVNSFLPFQVDTMEHVLPIADLWSRGPGSFSQRQGFIIHMERAFQDLESASKLLCERWGHCEPLPQLPLNTAPEVDTKFTSASWKQRTENVKWTEDVRSTIATLYAKDFELLGYDPLRPLHKDPIRQPGGWNPGGHPWVYA